ncbi:MAG: glycerol-3-phosphate dehydrogenase/oxidase [Pseudomonadota bacterium]
MDKLHNSPNAREETWSKLTGSPSGKKPEWDLLVIGGGITGAGILREAARRDLAAALIEQRDFAWGTSSRSSKMVHGGLRYLLTGQVKMTRNALQERDRLLREAPGLVDPMGFLFSHYRGRAPGRGSLNTLLAVYDILARRWSHRYYRAHEYLFLAPRININGLKGGTSFRDAITDDARLVLRTIREAQRDGALAMSYVVAEGLMTKGGKTCGVALRDMLTGETDEVRAKAVVNATGTWADGLRREVGGGMAIRPLRGSHLVFPFWRVPVAQAITLYHPADGRPVFLLPWEGVTVVGNTDLDHEGDLNSEASITTKEMDYLLEVVRYQFPSLGIGPVDILSTYSGVRPVIGTGMSDPSKEKRDHHIWVERGLISVSGGKLTTFRLMALDVLKHAAPFIPSLSARDTKEPVFREPEEAKTELRRLDPFMRRRLAGHYGPEALDVVHCAKPTELQRVPETHTLWAEVRWAARAEAVAHLDDLLLRRTRLGLLLREGGEALFPLLKTICREELGWDNERWAQEAGEYKTLWRRCYGVPYKENGSP